MLAAGGYAQMKCNPANWRMTGARITSNRALIASNVSCGTAATCRLKVHSGCAVQAANDVTFCVNCAASTRMRLWAYWLRKWGAAEPTAHYISRNHALVN